MLTPEQITALGDTAEALTEPLVDWLIQDIAERVSAAGQLTSTAAYEIWRAQNLGLSLEDIKKQLQKKLGVTSTQLETLLTQAAETGYNFDLSRLPTVNAIPFAENTTLQQIVAAAVKLAKDDLSNMTQTIGFVGPDGEFRELTDAYNQVCDFAFQKVATGAQDYISAVRDATRELAAKGIRVIDYESGVHTSLEAAVRRNVMGGLGLMQEQISQQIHDDFGCNGWEVSAHAASAPDHEPIQGKQYPDKVYIRLNNSLVRRIGTLNCGHAAFPIILGVNSPQYTPEELERFRQENEEGITYQGRHYTLYEATQKQRQLERTIRKQKKRILVDEAVGDKDKLQNDQIRYHVVEQEYRRFSKAAGLRLQHDRMEVGGFGPKQVRAAEKTTRIYHDIAKMAQPDALHNDWSKTVPRLVSKEEKASIISYAAERGIKIPGLRNFDGDPELLKAQIDALSGIHQKLPAGKKLTLSVSQALPDEEFASTSGDHITLNAKVLRDRKITEQNLASGNLFAGSKAEDIIIHEYGHVFSAFKGNKGIEIARKARYNITGKESSLDEILTFLDSNISVYSTTSLLSSQQHSMFNLKKYKEIIPEVIVKHGNAPDEFTAEFFRLLKELI